LESKVFKITSEIRERRLSKQNENYHLQHLSNRHRLLGSLPVGDPRKRRQYMSTTITWHPAATPPDDGETVIIHTLGGEVWTGFLDGKVWRNVSGARIHEEEPVLHWMPLPLPPEDEE
jgi:hypothetical protein